MDILSFPYNKMLVLGAISAASAFIATTLIVLVCVGCHTKSKKKHSHTNVESQKRYMDHLSKPSFISKSDTRLHEIHQRSANGASKDRPASMDLLWLESHHSVSEPYPPSSSCQLPCISKVTESENYDHVYQEDEGLYERVGVLKPPPPAPLVKSAQSQTITEIRQEEGEINSRGLNEAGQVDMMTEYASVRKVRKMEVERRPDGSKEENTSKSSNSTVHTKSKEPSNICNFPKGPMSISTEEEYIWKSPEESNIFFLKGPSLENGHNNANTTKIFETYSSVCKPPKKEHLGSAQQISGQIGSEEIGSMVPVAGEHCYEAVSEKAWSNVFNSDPAYATINPMQKRKMMCSSNLKPNAMSCETLQGPNGILTSENFYESIVDVKQGTNTTSTTTIFTFNDGLEMYVTGL